MLDVFVGEFAVFVFEPFLTDLIAADMKFPDRFWHASEKLLWIEPNPLVIVRVLNFLNLIASFTLIRDEGIKLGRFIKCKPKPAPLRRAHGIISNAVSGRRGNNFQNSA